MTENEIKNTKEWFENFIETYALSNQETIEFQKVVACLEEILQYRAMEQSLKEVYGDCNGLLEKVVDYLIEHKEANISERITKAMLLTNEDVDNWDVYRAIGTIEEFKALKEKTSPKKPEPIEYEKYIDVVENAKFLRGAYWCPNCKHTVRSGTYCDDCGQKLDWQ